MPEMNRVANEKKSYNDGSVYAASTRLQSRFEHVFACPNARRGEIYWDAIIARELPRSDVLELGCYEGHSISKYKSMGARTAIGIDISDVAVAKARANGIDALVMDAHNLEFPAESFDVVIGRSILHHLDYERAILEVYRVLRSGGIALFQEPLRNNPVGKLIRALTPTARTKLELPLSRQQIEWGNVMFDEEDHHFIGLASTGIGLFTSALPLPADNILLKWADVFDDYVSTTRLRYWMQRVILVYRKAGSRVNSSSGMERNQ